jgi:hypothetical protein
VDIDHRRAAGIVIRVALAGDELLAGVVGAEPVEPEVELVEVELLKRIGLVRAAGEGTARRASFNPERILDVADKFLAGVPRAVVVEI